MPPEKVSVAQIPESVATNAPMAAASVHSGRRIQRVQRIGSENADLCSVVESIAVGIRSKGVGTERFLFHVEQCVTIHVGNCAN
jgi:hypothetical protein